MPLSPKRQGGRKRAAAKRKVSEIEGGDSSHTAAKKKRTIRGSQQESFLAGSPIPENDDDSDDQSSSTVESQHLVDAVVPLLAVSNDPVAAATYWANTNSAYHLEHNTASYAKVCGRDWTYYVKDIHVYIGRPPDTASVQNSDVSEGSSPPHLPTHIDLGPSKLISRMHAELYFDEEASKWIVIVYGRNGVKVNDIQLRRGQRIPIRSGDVLEIVGTQMMFVAVDGQPEIHPTFLQKLRDQIPPSLELPNNGIQPRWLPENSRPTGRSSSQTQSSARSRVNGQAVLAPAPPDFRRSTPTKAQRTSTQTGPSSNRSPAFGRGIVMESSQLIDYSSDSAKDIKPGLSYATMIAQAITSTPDQSISLKGIYDWIITNFSYYRHHGGNWQNSIRHNLSLSPAFMKFPRGNNEPGKGANWCINPEKKEELMASAQKQLIKSGARHPSNPSSPAVRDNPASHGPSSSQPHLTRGETIIKTSPSRRTPPLATYPPTIRESYSPTRGPRIPTYSHSQALPVLTSDPSPLPHRLQNGRVTVMGSSPTLTSGPWMSERPQMTPAPRPHNLELPLPNTVKPPTSHMLDSSPAPFWKYTDQPPSTPAGWRGSPFLGVGLQSSSPPQAATNENESPTRKRGVLLPEAGRMDAEVDDDDGGIDLARGFPAISSFHRLRSTGTSSNVAA